MDGNLILATLGLIASIVIPATIHRQAHPKREVRFHIEVADVPGHTALVTSPAPARDPVDRVRLRCVTVSLWASGRADIPSSAFDGGRPLVIQFSAPILDDAAPAVEHDVSGWGFARAGSNQVILQPTIIGRGVVFKTEVIMDQPVYFRIRNPLIDIAVVQQVKGAPQAIPARQNPFAALSGVGVGVGLTIMGFVLSIIGIAVYDTQTGSPFGIAGVLLVPFGLAVVAVALTVRLIRWIIQRNRHRHAIAGQHATAGKQIAS